MATTKTAIPQTGKRGAPFEYQYLPEYDSAIVDYFNARQLRIRTIAATDKPEGMESASLKESVRTICSELPTFQGFAESIEVTDKVLRTWCEKWPSFKTAYARAKQMQERFFADGLSTGLMNPTGAIFVAKNILGWRDKIDIDSTNTTVDTGSNLMAVYLRHASPELLAEFRSVLDRLRSNAIAAGALDSSGNQPLLESSSESR